MCDISGLSPSCQRDCLTNTLNHLLLRDVQALAALRHHGSVEFRVNRTRAHGVDSHTVSGEFQGQRLCQADHPGFRRVVSRHQCGRILTIDRGNVDDASVPLALHDFARSATTIKRPRERDPQHALPLLVCQLNNGRDALSHAGAVDEDV